MVSELGILIVICEGKDRSRVFQLKVSVIIAPLACVAGKQT